MKSGLLWLVSLTPDFSLKWALIFGLEGLGSLSADAALLKVAAEVLFLGLYQSHILLHFPDLGREKRAFSWKTLSVWSLNEETGETKNLVSNEFVPPGLAVQMGNTNHSKTFSIGELLNFSSAEAYEIAMSLHMIWLEYIDQFSDLKGLPRIEDIPRMKVAYSKL